MPAVDVYTQSIASFNIYSYTLLCTSDGITFFNNMISIRKR